MAIKIELTKDEADFLMEALVCVKSDAITAKDSTKNLLVRNALDNIWVNADVVYHKLAGATDE